MSWWGCFWGRILTWFLAIEQPPVHGGNLTAPSAAVAVVLVGCRNLSVHQPRPLHCRVAGVSARAQHCAVHHLSPPRAQVCTVCAPSAMARVQTVPLAMRAQLRKPVAIRATISVSHRVLLCRYQPAIRARVRLLPKQVKTVSAGLQWRCRTQRFIVEQFRCPNKRSSLVWQLPIARRALPFGHLTEEHRRRCREALQRAAKGYASVQSVYYPVPAHAVARIEIDERVGVLYVHPRKGRSDTAPACLWVVSGVQLVDGHPVRAVLRVN